MTRSHSFSTRPPKSDLAYCHRIVQDVSRTFALTIDALDQPLSDHICVGYLLCRIPDTIEDAAHIPPTTQADLLRTYRRALRPDTSTSAFEFVDRASAWIPSDSESADWKLVDDARTVVATLEDLDTATKAAMRPPISELTSGMLRFVERYAHFDGIRIQTELELRSYCHYVAGTVGTLVTNLLTQQELPANHRGALRTGEEHFGRLLQLVNIAKDVHDDYTTENNVYLPAEWLAAVGVPQDQVLRETHRPAVAAVVERVLDQARTHLVPAREYIETMPLGGGNSVSAWAIPFVLAVATLRELENRPVASLETKPAKVSRAEVAAIATAVRNQGRQGLQELQKTISKAPLDQATID